MIVLGAHTKIWLKVECFFERLQSQIDRAESSTSGGQAVVNVRSLGLTLERALKHFLGRNILATV